jgi:hypothetical protein
MTICSRCKREIKTEGYEYKPPRDVEEVVCDRCLLSVVDGIAKAGLRPFSIHGLYSAMVRNDLKAWMKDNNMNPQQLEQWTGITRQLWVQWGKDGSKSTDLSREQIKASIYATLRNVFSRTR